MLNLTLQFLFLQLKDVEKKTELLYRTGLPPSTATPLAILGGSLRSNVALYGTHSMFIHPFKPNASISLLTLLQSERPKLYTILAFLSAIWLRGIWFSLFLLFSFEEKCQFVICKLCGLRHLIWVCTV